MLREDEEPLNLDQSWIVQSRTNVWQPTGDSTARRSRVCYPMCGAQGSAASLHSNAHLCVCAQPPESCFHFAPELNSLIRFIELNIAPSETLTLLDVMLKLDIMCEAKGKIPVVK